MKSLIAIVLALAFFPPVFAACPGCCSSHGGTSNSCSGSGRITCNDGTVSPTCSCASCGVASGTSPPTCILSATPSSIVLGGFSTLSALCSPAPTSYAWTNAGLSAASSSGTVYPTTTTSYGVAGTNANGTGSLASAVVSVSGPLVAPTCILTATPPSISSSGSVVLAASCTPAAASYSWTNSGFSSTTSSGTITPSAATTYSVRGSNAAGTGNIASTTVLVTQSCIGGQSWTGTTCECPSDQRFAEGQCYSPAPAIVCGIERWSVKTGMDADAGKVNTRSPIKASISDLISIAPPTTLPSNSRLGPTELNMYSVEATLTNYRITDDSDYHVVVTDNAGKTMIVELAHPDCVAASSVFKNSITVARETFNSRLRATTTYKTAAIPVRVYGVGFFDSIHGQLGVAPNGIELHPVVKIEFDISTGTQITAVPVNQTLTGTNTNDLFTSGAGNDQINGGDGVDTVIFSGVRADYNIVKSGAGFTITDIKGRDGTDTLTSIERLLFTDQNLALDTGVTQSAGQSLLLLSAVLGKPALTAKKPLVGNVIDLFDQGYSLQQLAGAIMRLPIWDVLTGRTRPTNEDIARYLLTTVNGVAPDANTVSQGALSLDTEIGTKQGNFLASLAASTANQARVGFLTLQQTGIDFQ